MTCGLLAVVRLMGFVRWFVGDGSMVMARWLRFGVGVRWGCRGVFGRTWVLGDGSSSQCTTRPLARLHVDRALRARGETGAQTHLWG